MGLVFFLDDLERSFIFLCKVKLEVFVTAQCSQKDVKQHRVHDNKQVRGLNRKVFVSCLMQKWQPLVSGEVWSAACL